MERIVVCLRWRSAQEDQVLGGADTNFSRAARALMQREQALGGRIVAWHARTFAFDFGVDAVEDALELLSGDDATRPFLSACAVGVAQGELVAEVGEGSLVVLCSGPALDRATALALLADPGEVLGDPTIEAVKTRQSVGKLETAPRLASGSRTVEAGRTERGLVYARRAVKAVRAVGWEATALALEALIQPKDTEVASTGRDETDGEMEPAPAELGAALRHGDAEAMGRLAAQLPSQTGPSLRAERIEALAYLERGETGQALRLLRSAKERAQELGAGPRCRAALGYGVGLAAAGRASEALLEGLEALARAREAEDASGERACARFIARLTAGAGHDQEAQAWEAVSASGPGRV